MTIFFISDTHFSHANILKFKDKNGKPIRPGFSDITHMNETIIENWNKVVQPSDKVYHMGDIGLGNQEEIGSILQRCNGKKRLILGNHDNLQMSFYSKYFEQIYSLRQLNINGIHFKICHYPLHISSFQYDESKPTFCVHGHTHQNIVDHPLYVNLCVEHTEYTPVSIDELAVKMKKSLSKYQAINDSGVYI